MSRTYETRYAERHRKAGKGYSGASVIFILLCCALTVFLLSTSYLGDKLVDQYITPTFAKIMGKTTPEPSQLPVMAPSQPPKKAATAAPITPAAVQIKSFIFPHSFFQPKTPGAQVLLSTVLTHTSPCSSG